jgi:phospholipase A1
MTTRQPCVRRFEATPLLRPLCFSLLLASHAVYAADTAVAVAIPTDQLPPPVVEADNSTQPRTVQACLGLESNAERLNCYDNVLGRHVQVTTDAQTVVIAKDQAVSVVAAPPINDSSSKSSVFAKLNPFEQLQAEPLNPDISLLDRRWELSDTSKLGTFNLRAYKPVYALPVFYTGSVNSRPTSPNPINQATEDQKLESSEAKFQLSFKVKAAEGLIAGHGDVWLGYTQSSRWQVFNPDESRPFRETNYEPEANLIFRTQYNLMGWNGRLLGLGVNHQSNGRSDPLSRSWNRLIGQVGLERGNWVVMLRPWMRFEEDAADDNNADIEDYMGRGDVQIVRKDGDQEYALMLRHSLKGGDRSHGAVQFDWTFPLTRNLRGYVQVFDGYGESLIDYNHRATYVGAGVSLLNWY